MNNPFDWESFSHKLSEHLPNWNNDRFNRSQMDFSWIQKVVEDALSQSFGRSTEPKQASPDASTKRTHEVNQLYKLKPKVILTMTEVIVKIEVPEGLNVNRIRVECSPYRMKLRVLPQQNPKFITLPAKVHVRQAKAFYKHEIVEIRLPKQPENEPYEQIPIRHKS